MKTRIVTFFILIACHNCDVRLQTGDYQCLDDSSRAGYLQIPTHTELTGQFLRILIIYITFPDDNYSPNVSSFENTWLVPDTVAVGTRPLNPYTSNKKFIDSAEKSDSIPFMNRYREYTYSDWFNEMSMGKLDIIGDEIFFRLPLSSSDYQTMQWRRNELNQLILRYVYDSLNIDFSRYDNWMHSNGQWIWEPDGFAEMIAIQF